MDNLNDIKQIWHSAKAPGLPTAAEAAGAIRKFRAGKRLKIALLLFFTLACVATMTSVLFNYHSHLISTRLGETFMFIAMFIILGHSLKALYRTTALSNMTNETFLLYLKNEQRKLFQFQQRAQVIGFAFAAIGLLLYLYEGVADNISYLLFAYAGTMIWISLMWFVVRPRALKKKHLELEQRIERLEKISAQLNNY